MKRCGECGSRELFLNKDSVLECECGNRVLTSADIDRLEGKSVWCGVHNKFNCYEFDHGESGVKMQMTINLTSKEVEDILRKYVEEKTGKKMGEAKPKITPGYDEGPRGSCGPIFNGYDLVMLSETL